MNKKGFTLTEMLIVVIIISGLMLLLVPNLMSTKDKVDDKTCDAYLKLVDSQIQAYYLDHNAYPTEISQLVGEYIEKDICANGNQIKIENNKATIVEVTTTSEASN